MTKYYNTTRNVLPLTLRTGKSASVSGKSYLTVTAEEDGSESIVHARSTGDLVLSKTHVDSPVTAKPVAATVPATTAHADDVSDQVK